MRKKIQIFYVVGLIAVLNKMASLFNPASKKEISYYHELFEAKNSFSSTLLLILDMMIVVFIFMILIGIARYFIHAIKIRSLPALNKRKVFFGIICLSLMALPGGISQNSSAEVTSMIIENKLNEISFDAMAPREIFKIRSIEAPVKNNLCDSVIVHDGGTYIIAILAIKENKIFAYYAYSYFSGKRIFSFKTDEGEISYCNEDLPSAFFKREHSCNFSTLNCDFWQHMDDFEGILDQAKPSIYSGLGLIGDDIIKGYKSYHKNLVAKIGSKKQININQN